MRQRRKWAAVGVGLGIAVAIHQLNDLLKWIWLAAEIGGVCAGVVLILDHYSFKALVGGTILIGICCYPIVSSL